MSILNGPHRDNDSSMLIKYSGVTVGALIDDPIVAWLCLNFKLRTTLITIAYNALFQVSTYFETQRTVTKYAVVRKTIKCILKTRDSVRSSNINGRIFHAFTII